MEGTPPQNNIIGNEDQDRKLFIQIMSDSSVSLAQKFSQLPKLYNLAMLNNFFCKVNPIIRNTYYGMFADEGIDITGVVISDDNLDPKRTAGQFWADIDKVVSSQNLTLLSKLRFGEFHQLLIELPLVDSSLDYAREDLDRWSVYKILTQLDDEKVIEKLTPILQFFFEFFKLYYILIEDFSYSPRFLGA